jgi:hypothetical protein
MPSISNLDYSTGGNRGYTTKGQKKEGKTEGKERREKHTTHPHQPLGNSQSPMRPHHTQTSNMPVLHSIRRLLLHLRKNIPHDLGVLARDIAGSAGARSRSLVPAARAHNGDEAQLRPGEGMVEVVFEEVVLG